MTSSTPTSKKVNQFNEKAENLPDMMDHPCLYPKIIHKDDLKSNDYNPNKVPDPELDLLEQSIREDGLTMPIVTYQTESGSFEIVDGFHRYLVLTDRIGEEWIPVSVIDKDIAERMSSTVRHNRARGDHKTELMGQLVESIEEKGKSSDEVAEALGMGDEEITRLKQVVGAADILANNEYAQSWGVQD